MAFLELGPLNGSLVVDDFFFFFPPICCALALASAAAARSARILSLSESVILGSRTGLGVGLVAFFCAGLDDVGGGSLAEPRRWP